MYFLPGTIGIGGRGNQPEIWVGGIECGITVPAGFPFVTLAADHDCFSDVKLDELRKRIPFDGFVVVQIVGL